MENSATAIENLIERIEEYSKTSFDLYRYSAIYETAALFSSLAVKLVLTMIVFIIVLLLTISGALWLGDLLGKTVYGFLCMGFFYVMLGLLIFAFKEPWIKVKISNFIIKSFELPKS